MQEFKSILDEKAQREAAFLGPFLFLFLICFLSIGMPVSVFSLDGYLCVAAAQAGPSPVNRGLIKGAAESENMQRPATSRCLVPADSYANHLGCKSQLPANNGVGRAELRQSVKSDRPRLAPGKTTVGYPSTPEAVVNAFVESSYRPDTVQCIATEGEVRGRLKYFTDPHTSGYDCNDVVTAWDVETTHRKAEEATVSVTYTVIGVASLDRFFCERRKETLMYHLIRRNGKWQIQGPRGAPKLSVSATIQLYRFWANESSVQAQSSHKAIEASRTCLRKK